MSHRSKLIRRRRYHLNWLTPERLQGLVAPILKAKSEDRDEYIHLPFYGTQDQLENYHKQMKTLTDL